MPALWIPAYPHYPYVSPDLTIIHYPSKGYLVVKLPRKITGFDDPVYSLARKP